LGWGEDSGRMKFIEFLECVSPEDRQSLKEKVNTIIDNAQTCQFEFRVNGLNGDNRYLEVKGKVQYDSDTGEALKMVGTLSNITWEKTSGRYFAGTERKYKAFLKNTFEVVMHLDENLDFSFVSPGIERVLGYSIRDLDWGNIVSYIHLEDITLFNKKIEEVSKLPESTVNFKGRYLHKDNSWRILESIIYNCLHEPSIRGFVINSRDGT
jgi:PAS domain S-box-containing protein